MAEHGLRLDISAPFAPESLSQRLLRLSQIAEAEALEVDVWFVCKSGEIYWPFIDQNGETLCGQWTACSAHLTVESQVVTSGWPLAVGQLRYGKHIALQSFEAEVAMFLHKEARRVKYFKILQARNPNLNACSDSTVI